MNTREAKESYYRKAKAHPVLIFGLYGICAGVAWNLPITLYRRIAAYLAMNFGVALARISFGMITGRIQLSDD
jgi:hypothetical protein